MSIRVMSKVWDAFPGSGSYLIAMLALADWSDDEGRCFPSMSAIASKTRLSRSQAQRVVHGLVDGGYIQVVGNELGGAPGATRQYRIVLSSMTGRTHATGSAHATGRTDAQDGSHGCAETGRTHATQTVMYTSVTVKGSEQAPEAPKPGNSVDTPKTTPKTPFGDGSTSSSSSSISKPSCSPSASEFADQDFAAFWKAYPRKIAKQDAEKAWRKVKPSKHILADLMAALERQKLSPDWQKDAGQFIPHAATWLNGRRWEDEPAQLAAVGGQPEWMRGAL